MSLAPSDGTLESQLDEIDHDFVRLAKKHGLNPVWLREIIKLRNRGLNHTQIGARLGISRDTVSAYLSKLGQLDEPDFLGLLLRIGLLIGGIYLLAEILGGDHSNERDRVSTPF